MAATELPSFGALQNCLESADAFIGNDCVLNINQDLGRRLNVGSRLIAASIKVVASRVIAGVVGSSSPEASREEHAQFAPAAAMHTALCTPNTRYQEQPNHHSWWRGRNNNNSLAELVLRKSGNLNAEPKQQTRANDDDGGGDIFNTNCASKTFSNSTARNHRRPGGRRRNYSISLFRGALILSLAWPQLTSLFATVATAAREPIEYQSSTLLSLGGALSVDKKSAIKPDDSRASEQTVSNNGGACSNCNSGSPRLGRAKTAEVVEGSVTSGIGKGVAGVARESRIAVVNEIGCDEIITTVAKGASMLLNFNNSVEILSDDHDDGQYDDDDEERKVASDIANRQRLLGLLFNLAAKKCSNLRPDRGDNLPAPAKVATSQQERVSLRENGELDERHQQEASRARRTTSVSVSSSQQQQQSTAIGQSSSNKSPPLSTIDKFEAKYKSNEQLIELFAQFYAHLVEANDKFTQQLYLLRKSSQDKDEDGNVNEAKEQDGKLATDLSRSNSSGRTRESKKSEELKLKIMFGIDDESLLKWLKTRQESFSSLKDAKFELLNEYPNRTINVCPDGPKILVLPNISDILYCYTREQWIEKLWLDLKILSLYHYPIIILNILIFLIGTTGNIFVCLSVYRNYQLRNVTNYFIVNLAFADLLVILICLPATVIWDLSLTWFFGTIPCKLIMFLQDVSISVSVLTLTAISIDRYYAICHPFKFKSNLSQAKRMIVVIWLVSLAIMGPDLVYLSAKRSEDLSEAGLDTVLYSDCNYDWSESSSRTFQFVKTVLLYLIPFILMFIAHFKIMKTLQKASNSIDKCSSGAMNTNNNSSLNSRVSAATTAGPAAPNGTAPEPASPGSFTCQVETTMLIIDGSRRHEIELKHLAPADRHGAAHMVMQLNPSQQQQRRRHPADDNQRQLRFTAMEDPSRLSSSLPQTNQSIMTSNSDHPSCWIDSRQLGGSRRKLSKSFSGPSIELGAGSRLQHNDSLVSNQSDQYQIAFPLQQMNGVAGGRAGSLMLTIHNKNKLESRRKAAKMLMAIVIMFGICYLPVHLINFLRQFIEDIPQTDVTSTISMLSHCICYLNSAINPIIYNHMNSIFRAEFKKFLSCFYWRKRKRHDSSQTGGLVSSQFLPAVQQQQQQQPTVVSSNIRLVTASQPCRKQILADCFQTGAASGSPSPNLDPVMTSTALTSFTPTTTTCALTEQ